MTAGNEYYEHTDFARNHTKASARELRAQLDRIQQGFGKLPSINDISFGRTIWGNEDLDHEEGPNHYKITTVYKPLFAADVTKRYRGGDQVKFIALKTSTEINPTIAIDFIGEAIIKEVDGSDLPIGGVAAGWVVDLIYDGEFFRSQNTANRQANFLLIAQDIGDKAFTRNQEITNIVLPLAKQGTAPYTYQVAGLPAGLAFNRDTRIISGTPTAIGRSTVTYTVTDASGLVARQRFQIRVLEQVNLTLPLPVDVTFLANVLVAGFVLPEATGGSTPYIYEVAGVPTGMRFDRDTRLVSGTPTATGEFAVTYQVMDSTTGQALTASQQFKITINAAVALTLPVVANRKFSYNDEIAPLTMPAATGGVAPYSYELIDLTAGLTFTPASRQLAGRPTAVGQQTVIYRVRDSAGTVVETTLNIEVTSVLQTFVCVVNSQVLDAATILDISNSFAASATQLTLPEWVGNRYLVILVSASLENLNSILFDGQSSLTDFDLTEDAVRLSQIGYDAYVSKQLVGGVVSGYPIAIGRAA